MPPRHRWPALLCGLTAFLLGACGGEERSPILLWDMRPGMTLAELDSISLHDVGKRHACESTLAGFQRCTMKTEGFFGEMEAIVDTSARVVLLTFRPDYSVMGGFTDMRGQIFLHAGMHSDAWDRLAERTRSTTEDGTAVSTWLTDDRRWGARLDWDGSTPVAMAVFDAAGVAPYQQAADRQAALATSRISAAAPQPQRRDPLGLLRYELRRLATEQTAHRAETGRYARELAELDFLPRSSVVLEIGDAGPSSWWARGTLRNSRPCYVWVGPAPAVPGEPPLLGAEGEPFCHDDRRAASASPADGGERDDAPDLGAAARNMITAQEIYYASASYAYADSPGRLDYDPGEEIAVEIAHAGPLGWAARLTDARDTSRVCTVVIGEVPADVLSRMGGERAVGRPLCSP